MPLHESKDIKQAFSWHKIYSYVYKNSHAKK